MKRSLLATASTAAYAAWNRNSVTGRACCSVKKSGTVPSTPICPAGVATGLDIPSGSLFPIYLLMHGSGICTILNR